MNNLSLSDEEEFDYEDYDLNKDDEDKLLEGDSTDNDVDIKKNEKSAPEAENEDDGEVLRLDIGEDLKLMESASESSKKENEHFKTTKDEKQQKNKERKVNTYDDLKRIRRISPVRSNRNTHRSRYRYNERKNSKYNYNRRKDRNNAILNFVPPPKYDDDDLTDRVISRSNNIEVHPQDKIRPDLLIVPNEQRTLIEVKQQSDYFIQQQQVQLPSLLDIKTAPPYLNQHDESFNSINSFSQTLSLSQENLFKQQLQPSPMPTSISPQLWSTSQQQQQQYQEPTSISPQLWPSTSQQQYQESQFYQQQDYYQEEPQYYQQQHQQDYIYQQGNCENGQIFSRFSRNETLITTQQNSNKGSVHSRLGVKKRIPPNNSNNHISNDSIDKIASPPPKQTALFVDEEYKRKMEEQKREREKIFKLKEERRLKDLTQQQQKFLQHKNKTNNNNTSNNNNNNNIVVKQLNQEKSTKILKTTTQLRSNNEVTKIDNVMPKKFTIKNELCEENIETVKNSNNSNVKLFMSDRLVVKKKAPLTNKPNIGRPLKSNTSIKSTTSTATSTITTMTKKPSLLSLDHDNNRNIINVDNNRNNNDISSFLNNRKIIAKDQQSRIPLIYISNLSVDTTKSRLLEIAQGIGEVQKIHHDPKERCATILFKDIAAAHLFYEQYQQYMLDLSVLDIRLVPRM